MSFARVYSAQARTTGSSIVSVETDISRGLHSFSIVGLPDKGIEEAKDRVAAAIKNSGYVSPKTKNQKVTTSLAPADIKKEGSLFDVPIALSYLLACGDISFDPENSIFVGELSLDGSIRPIQGALPLTLEAQRRGFKNIFIPKDNAKEAALVRGVTIYPTETLSQIVRHITVNIHDQKSIVPQPQTQISDHYSPEQCISTIAGQGMAKRALEIAAAGGHNLALYGPPGTGKSLLAKALTGLVPHLSFEEIIEVTSLYSSAGVLKHIISQPPFRSPHHTSSYSSIVGGGPQLRPGEITLAHRGILFLDEFLEFDRRVIDALREPLEERHLTITRNKGSITYPANTQLVIAMNPCPCGNFGIVNRKCRCTATTILQYQKKLSGPIIDRIDIWSEVHSIEHDQLHSNITSESSTTVRERVVQARLRQYTRYGERRTNSEIRLPEFQTKIKTTAAAQNTLVAYCNKFNISARSHHRIIKVAQTIADLQQKTSIDEEAVLEALQFRYKQETRTD